jgi:Flp pilus assembly protein TadG
MLCFLMAGTFVCGSIAASAAFLAQRDLAGICDGAAIAAANGFSRRAAAGDAASQADGPDSLPLDEQAVQRAVAAYRLHQLPADGAGPADGTGRADRGALSITVTTDGRVATVTCRRRVRIPFGALLGYRDGLDRTVVARARSPLD